MALMMASNGPTKEQVELIKRTIAKDATNDELAMFMHLSQKYGLDPFAKEIHFSKMGGRPSFIVGRDGYLKIAMSDPNFNGLQSFVVREGDHFEIDAENNKVIHRFGAKRNGIIGAWAMARHKSRPPVIAFVEFSEYKQSSPIWQKYPSAMIQKVAEVFVLRRQFNISGLVAQEELNLPDEVRSNAGAPLEVVESEHIEVVTPEVITPEIVDHPGDKHSPASPSLNDLTVAAEACGGNLVKGAKSWFDKVPSALNDDERAKLYDEFAKRPITDAKRQHLIITANGNGWSDDDQKAHIAQYGYTSRKEVLAKHYAAILAAFSQKKEA